MRIEPRLGVEDSRADLLQRLAAAQRRLADRSSTCILDYPRTEPLVACKRGRPGLASLGYPSRGYRVERATRHGTRFFETRELSAREDLFRFKGLLRAPLSKRSRRQARKLARRLLDQFETAQLCQSLASSVFLRELRSRITGAIWQLHDELVHLPRAVFTLIPRGLSLSEAELDDFEVGREMEALRGALRRAGSSQAGGCLILFLHGEWDDNNQRYQLHFHGWAAGGMINVVKRLRRQRRYDSSEEARIGDTDGVRNRVVGSRKPLTNPAYRISYRLQAFWPARRTGELAELNTGKQGRYRQRGKHRIPEPQHSQHLLWLDRWSIDDISLRIGLDVFDGRLRLNNPMPPSTNRCR